MHTHTQKCTLLAVVRWCIWSLWSRTVVFVLFFVFFFFFVYLFVDVFLLLLLGSCRLQFIIILFCVYFDSEPFLLHSICRKGKVTRLVIAIMGVKKTEFRLSGM